MGKLKEKVKPKEGGQTGKPRESVKRAKGEGNFAVEQEVSAERETRTTPRQIHCTASDEARPRIRSGDAASM